MPAATVTVAGVFGPPPSALSARCSLNCAARESRQFASIASQTVENGQARPPGNALLLFGGSFLGGLFFGGLFFGGGVRGQSRLRNIARNMPSVPCRCGQSWTVGPSPRSGTPGSRRPGIDQLQAGGTAADHPGRLGEVRRARHVRDHPARPDQPGRRRRAVRAAGSPAPRRRTAAAASGPPAAGAARRARCRARPACTRSNDAAGSPGSRPSAVCTRTGRPADGLPDQVGAVRGDLHRVHLGAALARPARRAAPPCRPGRRPGPASARRARSAGPSRGRSRPAASPRPARPPGRRRRPGSRPDRRPRGTPRTASTAPGCRPTPDQLVPLDPAGPGHQMHGGRLVVGAQRGLELVAGCGPSASCSALTIHRGCETAMARWPSGSCVRVRGKPARSRCPGRRRRSVRSTALTYPAPPGLSLARTRSTVADTAACGGIRVRRIW